MKKPWKKVVIFILVAIFTIPAINVAWAQEISSPQIEEMSQDEIDFYMGDLYENLSDDARSILEEYMMEYDYEMLNYYENITGRTVSNSELQIKIMFASEDQKESRAVAVTGMQYLGNSLRAMNLSTEVFNALMAVGADIAALGASITVSGVVAALAVVTVTVILYKNWDKVKGLWSRIVTAFKEAFAKSVSSSGAIENGFAKKKAETEQVQGDYKKGDSALRTGTLDKNADKHISKDFVDRMRKNNTPTEIYYSSKRRVLLYVYKVPNGYKTDLNEYLAKSDKEYDLTNYNVSGFTVYILINPTKGKVFHCHLRKNKSDLEQFRNANQLDWRFKPTPIKYESKYTNASGTGVFTGKQTD